MGKKSTKTRAVVLEILTVIHNDANEKLHILLRNVLDKYDYMDARDKALIKRLAEGCVEQQIKLDYVIGCYAKTKNGKMKPIIRDILRMGVYQILYMDSIPDFSACNEAVLLAGEKGYRGLSGFVNGVLRKIASEKDRIPWPEKSQGTYYLSVMYSMPEWIVKRWTDRYGAEQTEKMLAGILEISDLTLRRKESMSGDEVARWQQDLEKQDVCYEEHPYLSYAYVLKNNNSIEELPGYREGLFAVQDVSSMLAIELAGIKKGDFVVDVCAAPGGKAMHAAEKTGEGGRVLASDLLSYKVDLMQENADRMRLTQMQVRQWDALIKDESLEGRADVVIADLPCSGLGVMGRKSDIRYHVSEEGLLEVAKLQRSILAVAASYVKEGGILLYSTCTVNPDENEKNREWFLENNTSFAAESIEDALPEELKGGTGKDGHLQLLPGVHKCDGFYIAKFRKKK